MSLFLFLPLFFSRQKKENKLDSPESVAFIVALGTKVRSAARVNARITDHIGLTSPFQVYLGMYLFSFEFVFPIQRKRKRGEKWWEWSLEREKEKVKNEKKALLTLTQGCACGTRRPAGFAAVEHRGSPRRPSFRER